MALEVMTMPYIKKLIGLGSTLERGEVHHVAVRHDELCSFWITGRCTCDAEVELTDGPPRQWRKDLKRRFREKRRTRKEE